MSLTVTHTSLTHHSNVTHTSLTRHSNVTHMSLTHHSNVTHTSLTHHSHVTLGGVNPLCDGLNGHPAKREFSIRGLDVDVILSSQSKVRDLQHLVLPNQHIPAGKVSVDNAQFRQKFLQSGACIQRVWKLKKTLSHFNLNSVYSSLTHLSYITLESFPVAL